jgi:hypothetical protein
LKEKHCFFVAIHFFSKGFYYDFDRHEDFLGDWSFVFVAIHFFSKGFYFGFGVNDFEDF